MVPRLLNYHQCHYKLTVGSLSLAMLVSPSRNEPADFRSKLEFPCLSCWSLVFSSITKTRYTQYHKLRRDIFYHPLNCQVSRVSGIILSWSISNKLSCLGCRGHSISLSSLPCTGSVVRIAFPAASVNTKHSLQNLNHFLIEYPTS